jgi:protein O-GlcNAc transferase
MSRIDDQQTLQNAFALHQSGNVAEAAKLYRQLITRNPNNPHALHFLGVIEAGVGNIQQAEALMARSLSAQPSNVAFMENYAAILIQKGDYHSALRTCRQGLQINRTSASLMYASAIASFKLQQWDEALSQFDRLLAHQPDHIVAMNERGAVLAGMKRLDAALASFEKALSLNPRYAEAYLNKGNACTKLGRYDEAFVAYDNALALKPDLADAWLGRGNLLRELKRYQESVAAHDHALVLNPNLAEAWLGRGNALFELKRYSESFAAYDKSLVLNPDLAEAWLGHGNAFFELKRHDDAVSAYDKALALRPDLAEAWLGRGNVFFERKRYDEALIAFDKALASKTDLAAAWVGRGHVFDALKRFDAAFAAYEKALALNVDATDAEGGRLHAKMQVCDWRGLDAESAHLIASIRNGHLSAQPFVLIAIPSTPDDQLQCAKLSIANRYPPSEKPVWQGERYDHDRVRVAYLSADFQQHATALLMAGMLESHDKSRFEITAISCGPDDGSEMRTRLKASFERFVDAASYSDDQIANLVRTLEVDILIDLKGFTAGARTSVFAKRCAPIQVNYLGYPGTMGAPYIDYIIADRTLIPENQEKFYTEKIVFLPDCYQVNDATRSMVGGDLAREEVGLPPGAFVFCCFNNNYKITPTVFDRWMRILKQVEASVLWLLEDNALAVSNLRKEAAASGIDARRLVFAKRAPMAEHLARHRLADLFLDTLPYNAHTTASDALWAGLPIVTCLGETLAGRVAASLLTAVGLPELIATTPEIYETLAVDLATNRNKLTALRQKLAINRATTPLFDTKLFTKHIEEAYMTMWENQRRGQPAQSFGVG